MIKYLVIILVSTLSTISLAKSTINPKQVQVPFINQAVNSTEFEGLSVNYNMNKNPTQQVVCTLANFYKGWIDYIDNQAVKESSTYGGVQTVIFTSKGQTGYITETLDQFHADAIGHLSINDGKSNAFVSCFYMPDENNNK